MRTKHFPGPCKSWALGTVLIVPDGEADPACYSAWLMSHAVHGKYYGCLKNNRGRGRPETAPNGDEAVSYTSFSPSSTSIV